MELSSKILSEITIYMKYAKYLPEKKRRETWEEIVQRNKRMHLKKYPHMGEEIENAFKFVLDKKVLPSMRSIQFGGRAAETNPTRMYNCSYVAMDDVAAFSEILFLLLSGAGVGYSIQGHHVEKLPVVRGPLKRMRRFLVGDSVEGWADSVKVLMNAYFFNKSDPDFDFSDIREKGSVLVTSGGKAPGPQPLKNLIHNLRKVLDSVIPGEKLTPIQVHDLVCFLADSVLSGGIRRSACIALFSLEDDDMLACKNGKFWEENPQRARANNSVVLLRHRIEREDFDDLWKRVQDHGTGEPGIFFTNDSEMLCNPSLRKGTKVLTNEGIKNIEELENKEFKVKNLYGKWSDATCFLSGKEKELIKITLQNNKVYYATPQHKWPVLDEDRRYITKKLTSELKIKDKFIMTTEEELGYGEIGDQDDGFLVGWLYGDGWITKRKDNGKIQYGLIVGKKDAENGIKDKLTNILKRKIFIEGRELKWSERKESFELNFQRQTAFDYFSSFGVGNKKDGLPALIWTTLSEEFRKGFVDGLFSSDGCIYINKNAGKMSKSFVTLSSAKVKLLEEFGDLLGFYGIRVNYYEGIKKATSATFPNGKSYEGKEYYFGTLRIMDSSSVQHFRNIFPLSHALKQEKLNKMANSILIPHYHRSIRIKGIEQINLREDVWDLTVFDSTHCFQLSHCITGNCGEITLKSEQFCNLSEINFSAIENQEDLNNAARAAAFLGTLQAGYTNFHYLRDTWQQNTEKEALIGCSITGLANTKIYTLNFKEAAKIVKEENKRVAKLIGIKSASRCNTVKPSGTSSIVLGTSSGIHSWHSPYYIRRLRVMKNEPIYKYLKEKLPELVEDDFEKPHVGACISFPIKSPDGAITRNESALDLLQRVKYVFKNWIVSGHVRGNNKNNVSCTVSVKDYEWSQVGDWLWNERDSYNGISILPYWGGTYKQAPFEECTKEKYEELMEHVKNIDLAEIVEDEDNTKITETVSCSGGSCEVKFI